jgi:hypothetical protein
MFKPISELETKSTVTKIYRDVKFSEDQTKEIIIAGLHALGLIKETKLQGALGLKVSVEFDCGMAQAQGYVEGITVKIDAELETLQEKK